MPLWDSVQRGLGKAQQEAARIAKAQKLRSTADGLSRQIYTQGNALQQRTMELFTAGQLTQMELFPLCQEVANLQMQLNQVQNELKQLQAAQPPSPQMPDYQTGAGGIAGVPSVPSVSSPYPSQNPMGAYPQTGDSNPGGVYAPPPPPTSPSAASQAYFDSTNTFITPPPPPGMEAATTISNMAASYPGQAIQRCVVCQSEIYPNTAFCQVCGTQIQQNISPNLPTVRGSTAESFFPEEHATYLDIDATVRAQTPHAPLAPPPPPPPASIAPPPPPPRTDSAFDAGERDKGV